MTDAPLWTCPVCETRQPPHAVATIVWRTPVPGPKRYDVIRCDACTVAVSDPIPSDDVLAEYYAAYEPTELSSYRTGELVAANRPIARHLVERARLVSSAPVFLDYGYGAGAFIKAAGNEGATVYGAEFSGQNIDQLQRDLAYTSAHRHVFDLREDPNLDAVDEAFHCITLFQVIEHMQHPRQLLCRLRQLQPSGGFVYLECPNQDSTFYRVKNLVRHVVNRSNMFGGVSPPQHIYGFNRKSLSRLLEAAGYMVEEVGDYPFGDGFHQPETQAWYPNLEQFVGSHDNRSLMGAAKMAIRYFDTIASKAGRAGSGLYALAVKP